jgi:hypothetical protein
MHYAGFLGAAIGIAATLFIGVGLVTEPVTAKGLGNPCKQPKPVCGRGLVAVCTRHVLCGCIKWACGPLVMKPPNVVTKPPMTKPPLKPPKPLPR